MQRKLTHKSMIMILLWLSVLMLGTQTLAAGVELTHFTYSGHGDKWRLYLTTMAERFKAQTGITVNIEVSAGDYRSKLIALIAGGVAPDITDAHPVLAAPFVGQGMFEDLTPYIKRDRVPLERMPPTVLQGVTTPDGAIWGLPVSIYPVVTFYNADMFQERGIQNPRQLGANWTWDAAKQSAKRLTVDKNADGKPEVYGTNAPSSYWEIQVKQAGGLLYDRMVYPTRSMINTAPVLKAVEFLQEFYREGWAHASGDYQVFKQNSAFNFINGPGFIGPYYQDVTFHWDVAVQPKGPASRGSRVSPDGFQVVAQGKHKDAAWQWVKFLTANADNQLEMAKITGRIPSLREVMVKYPKISETLKLPDNWAAFSETAFDPDGFASYVVPKASSIDPIISGTLQRVWNGSLAPETALQQIHEQVSAVLKP